MSVGKACLTEEIITDWRQKKKNGEGGEATDQRRRRRRRKDRQKGKREDADKHLLIWNR